MDVADPTHRHGGATSEPFVGRVTERAALASLIGSATSSGGALVVRGEAGIGKTALLERAVADAGPARCLWVRGLELEMVLPYGAAADLLRPLAGYFADLPGVQRSALEVSLALAAGPAPSPLAVCAAVLGVLAAAGEERPLVVVVDDYQWLDPPSRQALLFAAHRLGSEQVVMLIAVRDEPGECLELGLPTLRLTGLDPADVGALADALGIEIARDALDSLVEHTGGNPLAVVEALPTMAVSGGPPALGPTLDRAWSAVFDRLPEPTRQALFVVAAARSLALGDVVPVLQGLGLSLADLAPAERGDLVRADGTGLMLRHPLLRPVVLGRTPLAVRLASYRALAECATGDVRAWYLAAASPGPDDAVAALLVAAAESARQRSGFSASARIWRRAAELTEGAASRAERQLHAATDAFLAGESELALRWCDDALRLRPDALFAADVELLRGRANAWANHPTRAYQDLVRAAEAVVALDPGRAARLYAEAAFPCAMDGRPFEMLRVARLSESVAGDGSAPTLQSLATIVPAFVLLGRLDDARRRLAVADSLVGKADPVAEQQFLAMCGQAWIRMERFDVAHSVIATVVDVARRTGASAALGIALGMRSELDWWTGLWSAAYADAVEALEWAVDLRQVGVIGYSLNALARLDAARGDVAQCHGRIRRARETVGPYGIGSMEVFFPSVLGLCALGGGDNDGAISALEQAWRSGPERGMGNPNVIPFVPDLVEAHIRAGNRDRAEVLLGWLEERAAATSLAYPAAGAARCRGMLAEDPDVAAAHHATARAAHDRCPMPFERARTLLCEGESLRRARRPAAARLVLRDAQAAFESLGARPWAARTARELTAAGARALDRPDRGPALDVLTPQEFQVARSVADGLQNDELAAALFVSRKTVEAHLTRIYRKLGIRSRSELVRYFPARQVD